jgi:FkbM family methyltransferase
MKDLETKIVAHHVGGRGFVAPFKPPQAFNDDVVHVLYEADTEAAATMIRENGCKNRIVLPFCLGLKDGRGTLNITANPYASSLLEPNPRYFDHYCEIKLQTEMYDAIYGEIFRVTKQVAVDIHTLDHLVEEGLIGPDRIPDFLSLDTQGSEYDIIEGGAKTIREHVLGIATEIEFHPMYNGQKLFPAVFEQITSMDFNFIGFLHLQEISPYYRPLGRRAKGFVAFGDALFLRRIESLSEMAPDPSHQYLLALKLAFVAVHFMQIEYALKLLRFAASLKPDPAVLHTLRNHSFYTFLMRMQGLDIVLEAVYPAREPSGRNRMQPGWPNSSAPRPGIPSGWLGTRAVKLYNEINQRIDCLPHARIHHLLFSKPAEAILRIVGHTLNLLKRLYQKYYFFCRARQPVVAPTCSSPDPDTPSGLNVETPGYTDMESLFFEFGYSRIGDTLRMRRQDALRHGGGREPSG